jgi:V8-like Glu-specific endopeptidase
MDDTAVRIQRAADEFNWPAVEAAAADYSSQLRDSAGTADKAEFKEVLDLLRSHRRYEALTLVIDALLGQGVDDAVVRRLYAQAQIEQGYPAAALLTLESLAKDLASDNADDDEQIETRGSIGRCHKELYLRTTDRGRRASHLNRALSAYHDSYREDRRRYWSGINAVALLSRAESEGVPIPGVESPDELSKQLAREVLVTVRSDQLARETWAMATAVEAFVALADAKNAERALERLITLSRPDAFALNSLLRQLTEIWNLDTETSPGSTLLPQLRSELLRKTGGVVLVEPRDVGAERLEKLPTSGLEKVLGKDRYQTLTWYIKGLERCRAVARVETTNEDGLGTGFLVRGPDLHRSLPPVVLMTNGHVIPEGIDQAAAVVAFHATTGDTHAPQRFRVVRRWWYSPSHSPELDTTLLELDGHPDKVTPVPIARRVPNLKAETTPRAYVIGHPRGLEQPQFSLQDNHILGLDKTRLHYRSPTEPGSSGSPVFDKNWDLIALHHSGSTEMPRLDGQPGLYAANEGILVTAIMAALEARPPSA